MPRTKPPPVRLHEIPVGTLADFYALLVEKSKGATRDGKPFYTCRFRDAKRTVSYMAWADGPLFERCEKEWREGQFYKVRAVFGEHERYGPQIEIQMIRQVQDAEKAKGFDPNEFVEHHPYAADRMLAGRKELAQPQIEDNPLQRLVVTILDKHAEPLKRLPATQGKFYPFCGGLLEHTLSVTWS